MNNGLHGRYLEQLEAWNRARKIAAEMVAAFHQDTVRSVLSEWRDEVDFPSMKEIKQVLMDVIFLDGRNTIDEIARAILSWGEPDNFNSGHPAVAA